MSIHGPLFVMSMGAGVETGSALVPDPVWLTIFCRKVAGSMFIRPVLPICGSGQPGIRMPGMHRGGGVFCPLVPPPCCAAANPQETTSSKTTVKIRFICRSLLCHIPSSAHGDRPAALENPG
jgi:hypothetical protein